MRFDPIRNGFSVMDPRSLEASSPYLGGDDAERSIMGGTVEGRVSGIDGYGSVRDGKGVRRSIRTNREAIRARMYMAIAALFGIFFAAMMGIVYYLAVPYWIAVVLTVLIIIAQWWWGPSIVKLLFKIKWLDDEAAARGALGDGVYEYVVDACRTFNVKQPRLGIVEDDNPNAFTFGRTRNDAFLVITRGITKYCDKDETKAVVAHEMGHIVNNDFVIMTVVAAIPIIFYVLWRGIVESMRMPGDKKGAGYALIVAAISYVAWIISQYIALCVSRYREYYADDFAARTTGDANKLSTALIKICYGITKERSKTREEVAKKSRYVLHDKLENSMYFQSPGVSRGFALSNLTVDATGLGDADVRKAMEWDMRNVWARIFELNMTHPLTSKRIRAMGKVAREQGRAPVIPPEVKFGGLLWGDFARDVAWKYAGLVGLMLASLLVWFGYFGAAIMAGCIITGVALFLYWGVYHHPLDFEEARIRDLVTDVEAGPVRGRAVRLKGKVVGRGVPGLYFSEDLKLDDGSGIMLLDYHQVSNILNALIGLFRTKEKIGSTAVVDGWYRRAPVPYVEIYRMSWANGGKGRTDTCYTYHFKLAMAAGLIALGIVALPMLALGISGIVLLMMTVMAVTLGIPLSFWLWVGRGSKKGERLEAVEEVLMAEVIEE